MRREIGVFNVERSDTRSFGTVSWPAPGTERGDKTPEVAGVSV